MGQKVNPVGFRLGIIRPWASKWYAEKNYAEWLHEDIRIRTYLEDRFKHTGISKIDIERMATTVLVTIHTAKPGILIGKRGSGIDGLREEIDRLTASDVRVNIQEVRKAELDAKLVAEGIATQLERRVSFRRAMKKAVQTSMKFGAQGIRINCAGRLGGADMGRREWYLEGRVPLHTLRADIDYGVAEAATTYGIIGIKVWIFKGEVLDTDSRL
ncbi:30S ribosomal protein S3 [Bradymonas sediminis]|uniref:Small ribosomal subunit protein uS3 n=1 Tax=Bradymonas sediminis TaxID=1548548 RepID=A0A2Z4FGW5_9DELT|nr:30S ribosomal protein S3 [Bradymonas sediminis]AWV87988.1 30S ribosomal protein S3 [Bradymonas sediminis]TDP77112.1 SSU ribosomal protein S3P [Bradymonas sediminis]